MIRRMLLAGLFMAAPSCAWAEPAEIRIWGTPAMQALAQDWADAYRAEHPDVTFAFGMAGSDSAIHGLVGDAADIALMGRENDVVDDNGFNRPKQYPAVRLEVATGSVSTPGKSEAIAVLVHPENPLTGLTVGQLANIIDCGDNSATLSSWRSLGLDGEWADAPIRVHAYDFATRTGRWLQDRIADSYRRMCWDRISEYANTRLLDGTVAKAADMAGRGAIGDRYALVIANAGQAFRGLKPVAVAPEWGDAVLPTRESVQARTYPLFRPVFAFVDKQPGKNLPAHVEAFLRFVLSKKGQTVVDREGDYLPLGSAVRQAQLDKLENSP